MNTIKCVLSTDCGKDRFGFFNLAEALLPLRRPKPLKRVFSLMRSMGCKFLVEEDFSNPPFPDEVGYASKEQKLLSSLYHHDLRVEIARLSFFKCNANVSFPFTRSDAVQAKKREQSLAELSALIEREANLICLGYLYLVSYIDPRTEQPISVYVPHGVVNSVVFQECYKGTYIHSVANYRLQLLGKDLPLVGSLFAQQEGTTWCCAHAALSVVLANMSRLNASLPPIDYFEMNALLSIDHEARFASRGLDPREMSRILAHVGLETEVYWVLGGEPSYWDDLFLAGYHAIEAGLPAIVCFEGEGVSHAMAVVGHSFDPHLWPARATGAYFTSHKEKYNSSHSWVESLIVQDDNFGPYCTLPRQILAGRNSCIIVPRLSWANSTDIHGVELFAKDALTEQFFADKKLTYLQSVRGTPEVASSRSCLWFRELVSSIADMTFVLRTIPCTWDKYREFLTDEKEAVLGDSSGIIGGIEARLSASPFWLIEISIPELFQTNTRRIGEITVREIKGACANKNGGEHNEDDDLELCTIRVPGVFTIVFKDGKHQHYPISGCYHSDILSLTPEVITKIL